MKVAELMEALGTMPPEAEVIGFTYNPETSGHRDVVIAARLDRFLKVKRAFRDMMDRTDYQHEVYERDGKGTPCVEILVR
jgi:hypothetical protein